MPNAAAPPASDWLAPALLIVGALTALRVAALAFAEADLFVDEAQYWLWGQELAFGYYSKPPLIAWLIRLSTEMGGSDAAFWIRLPAPLLHGATALILGSIAARLHSGRAGLVAAAAFATLPMVAVGSLLISTDTVMFPFLAGALALYLRLLAPGATRQGAVAAAAGLLLGLAFLAKYAAAYYLALGALAALHPRLRPRSRDAALLLAAFAATMAPNLTWNLANGLSTLSHTVDNTGWRGGLGLDPAAAARFLAEQALVFGPVLFPALLIAGAAALRHRDRDARALLAVLSLPVVALVTGQALVSGANANWAAAAYVAGTPLAVAWLLGRRRLWLVLSFVANGVLTLAVPLAAVQAGSLRLGDRLLLARYVGLDELSRDILAVAEARGAAAILANERAVLADLFHTGRDAAVPVFAWPHDGPPRNHYEQRHGFSGQTEGPVLAVTRGEAAPPCAGPPDGAIEPGPGAYAGRTFRYWLVPADCWTRP